jgi:hypothetical protein
VNLGRDPRISTEPRRLVWRNGASWSVGALIYLQFWSEFASAHATQVNSLSASVTAVYLLFFVFGRVST